MFVIRSYAKSLLSISNYTKMHRSIGPGMSVQLLANNDNNESNLSVGSGKNKKKLKAMPSPK